MRHMACVLAIIIGAYGCGGSKVQPETKRKAPVATAKGAAGEVKVDSCISVCNKPDCMQAMSHNVGGSPLRLPAGDPSAADYWVNIPDSAINDFRLDFYDVDGQRLAVVTQKCPMDPPVRFDARAVLAHKPHGTYFISVCHEGVSIGTAKFEWR